MTIQGLREPGDNARGKKEDHRCKQVNKNEVRHRGVNLRYFYVVGIQCREERQGIMGACFCPDGDRWDPGCTLERPRRRGDGLTVFDQSPSNLFLIFTQFGRSAECGAEGAGQRNRPQGHCAPFSRSLAAYFAYAATCQDKASQISFNPVSVSITCVRAKKALSGITRCAFTPSQAPSRANGASDMATQNV